MSQLAGAMGKREDAEYLSLIHISEGECSGVYFTFDLDKKKDIQYKIGVSYVSVDNARKNLRMEPTSIGMLYQGLVLSTMKDEDAAQAILDVFSSFITDEISDFNSNVYYTNPDYLRCSYLEGKMLA